MFVKIQRRERVVLKKIENTLTHRPENIHRQVKEFSDNY